ncbi:MAG: BrxA/BrxB family bacilliredoxin [Acidobacteriota bacterium]|nr:BrxA/BrxB family bacilliredoxin [Acidobacteriota bacterium]
MYPEELVQPMREDLTRAGFREMKDAEEVDSVLGNAKGTTLLVVNSICGCAAGKARPAVVMALEHSNRPNQLVTVFAGQDVEATARARAYLSGYEPSSPSIALLLGGKPLFMLERWQIEGRPAEAIAGDLVEAFDRFCAPLNSVATP